MPSYVTASTAPSERGSSSFSSLPTAATGAPFSAFTICTAAVPTAPAAAVTSTRAPKRDAHELGERDPGGEERHREGGALREARARAAEEGASAGRPRARSA